MAASETFQAPRGMRDFYPEDMVLRNTIFDTWKKSAQSFGFSQYDASVVETLDLLKRKSGEEIVNQIYDFTDKNNRELALRPEMTPTLARMITARQGSLSFPLKWFAVAQCFRYERTTRGRKREHYQWNLDIIGENSVSAEAEVLACAIDAITSLGIDRKNFKVHFSSRTLLSDLMVRFNIPIEHHQGAFLALDKKGKIEDSEIETLLEKEGLDTETVKKVFSLFDIASIEDAEEVSGASTVSMKNLRTFLEIADSYKISDVLSFDISVIRGLAYYTGIVFEAFDSKREFRAIFGGGRYDNLLSDIGGKPATGVGLGFGDVVISEILSASASMNPVPESCMTAVGFMQDAQRKTAIRAAASLRKKGHMVDLALAPEKPGNFFSRAGKKGFLKAAYIGPDDVTGNTIRIKDMSARTEELFTINDQD